MTRKVRAIAARLSDHVAQWRFRFHEGRGDCLAGCTAAVNSLVAYDRSSRTARLISRDTVGQP